jgi:hypothetical protein
MSKLPNQLEEIHSFSKFLNEEKLCNLPSASGVYAFWWIGEIDLLERFYMEDLVIGIFRPWFNLDSER